MADGQLNTYWLLLPENSKQFAEEALRRFREHVERLDHDKRLARIRRSWRMHYLRGRDGSCDDTEIGVGGRKGELVLLKAALYSTQIQHQLALVTQNPPGYEPTAKNTDPESESATVLAGGILDHYDRVLHGADQRVRQAEWALVLGEAFRHEPWDPMAGEQHGVEDMIDEKGEPVLDDEGVQKQRKLYQGEFRGSVLGPLDVAYDPQAKDPRRPPWWVLREPENKHVLVKQYPEHEAAILGSQSWSACHADFGFGSRKYESDDYIPVYYVYAEPDAACEGGRLAKLLDDGTVLQDTPLDEERAPVFRLSDRDVIMDTGGHASNFGALPVVEAYQASLSTILSNHNTLGQQQIGVPNAANVRHHVLAQGLAVLGYDHVDPKTGLSIPKPEAINLLQTKAESFTFLDVLEALIDMIMGVNAAMRGDPDALKGDSGSKVAMLHAAAQQFATGFMRQLARCDEDLATYRIQSLRKHGNVRRVIQICGEDQEYAAREFVGRDLNPLSRVIVRAQNPATDTMEGRMLLADKLIGMPPELRDSYVQMLRTGRMDPVTKGPAARRQLICRENAALRDPSKGPVIVLPTDRHLEHIAEHEVELADPLVRQDPKAVQRCLGHIEWHIEALTPGMPRFAGMAILAATGQKPFPPVPTLQGEASMDTPQRDLAEHVGDQPDKPSESGPAPKAKVSMPTPPVDKNTGQPAPINVPDKPQVAGGPPPVVGNA